MTMTNDKNNVSIDIENAFHTKNTSMNQLGCGFSQDLEIPVISIE